MKTRVLLVCSAIALVGLMSSRLVAQTTSDVNVRFRTFGWDKEIHDLCYMTKSQDTGLAVAVDARSKFYDYFGAAEIVFYRISKDAQGSIVRTPAATTNLASAGTWPLLIFFADPHDPAKFRIQTLPDDLKAFPVGTFEFANYSTLQVEAKIGASRVDLPPREVKVINEKPGSGDTTLLAQVTRPAGGKQELLYSNNWAFRPAQRTLVFISKDPDVGSQTVVRRIMEDCTLFLKQMKATSSAPSMIR